METHVPYEAETAAVSAMLGDEGTTGRLIQMGLAASDFGDEKLSIVAQICYRIAKEGKTVDRTNVAEQLRAQGHYGAGKLITPEFLAILNRGGTREVVERAPQYAEHIIRYSIARKLAAEGRLFAETVLSAPLEADSLARAHAERVAGLSLGAQVEQDHTLGRYHRQELRPVPGYHTGIPVMDAITGGDKESQLQSIVGMPKWGKTRLWLMWKLHPIRSGTKVAVFLTDNSGDIFYNRLLVLLATLWMWAPMRDDDGNIVAPHRAPEQDWNLDPLELDLQTMTPEQRQAIEWAQNELDRIYQNIWVFDSASGIHDFSVMLRHLQMCQAKGMRLWVLDHVADLMYQGKKDVEAFNYIVTTLKSANARWHTTGLVVNQYSGNAAYNSYMGVILPASVDHLIKMEQALDEAGKWDKSICAFTYEASRWADQLTWQYRQNKSSGLWLNYMSYPRSDSEFVRKVKRLPYIGGA